MEYYAKNCELVLGLVCPVGVNLEDVQTRLISIFEQFRYSVNFIHLSELAKTFSKAQSNDPPNELNRLDGAMNLGTELREKYGRGDFFALLAIDAINAKRAEEEDRILPLPRHVHIIRSLKHADEVETLRQVYGAGFFLLGVSANIETRKGFLKNLKGIPGSEIGRLIETDDKESRSSGLGQQTRNVFQLADAFVTTDDTERLSHQLSRIIDLLFSKPVVPPTIEEYAMFMAYAASLRSADLSRQVGAVIMNKYSDIVSTGANDVPKFGGGLYETNNGDQRDYVLQCDSNERERKEIAAEVIKRIKGGDPTEEDFEKLKSARIMDITEFGRAVHAEMESLLQAARNGISIREATLYTTTYPCHNCAKHVVVAGIKEVVYIEPYPKSYAVILHSDSINAEGGQDQNKVLFRQFVGVGPRRFVDLFSMHLSSGRKIKRKRDGIVTDWQRSTAELRVPMTPLSYLESELKLVNELTQLTGQGANNESQS